MAFEMTDTDQKVVVYHYTYGSGEYITKETVLVPRGTGIPADCTEIKPPAAKKGYARCFDPNADAWSQIEDNRGQTVYSVHTLVPVVVGTLGALSADYTATAPSSMFDVWDGKQWIRNTDAEKQANVAYATEQKKSLRALANDHIQTYQDAIEDELATDDEVLLLGEWKKFRLAVTRIDVNDAPEIEWPTAPSLVPQVQAPVTEGDPQQPDQPETITPAQV